MKSSKGRRARLGGSYVLGQRDEVEYVCTLGGGLDEKLVRDLSARKAEPEWMRNFRLKGLTFFERLALPGFGVDLSGLDWEDIGYYHQVMEGSGRKWEEVPEKVRETFKKIGVPEAEQEVLAGVKSQYDSEVIYGSLKKSLAKKGVIFMSMDEGLAKEPDLVRRYMGKVVGVGDNKLAALNSAVWSGGSFVYVPAGVEVGLPLQAYFRINAEKSGQFERTLIVAEEGSKLHYVEGCSAPAYSSSSLHAAVVEVIVKKGAKVQYTTIQNWYRNVYNLVTKRAVVEEEGEMRWVDGNLGSQATMKYPACILKGRKARGEMLSIGLAGEGQHQDVGAKMVHKAKETSSRIVSKSISRAGGRSSYRGLVQIDRGTKGSRSQVICDGLILDNLSRADTYPINRIVEKDVVFEHEAKVSKISEEELFYLMSRGLSEAEAETMIVNGFLEPVVKQVPFEYAIEMNRLVDLEMERRRR